MRKLAECCVDGSVNWSAEELDADMAWFKKNRIQIMENIPSLTKGTKRKVARSHSTSALSIHSIAQETRAWPPTRLSRVWSLCRRNLAVRDKSDNGPRMHRSPLTTLPKESSSTATRPGSRQVRAAAHQSLPPHVAPPPSLSLSANNSDHEFRHAQDSACLCDPDRHAGRGSGD
jgi:hypothetical protein